MSASEKPARWGRASGFLQKLGAQDKAFLASLRHNHLQTNQGDP
jgi:hypothetical protein